MIANNSPLDAYNQQANQSTFEMLLQNHGWKPASADRLRWTRPGKEKRTRVSLDALADTLLS
jgi:hypothetical protein